MWETSTSDGPAIDAIRAPTFTAMPPTFPAIALDLARVHAGPDLDAEVLHRVA